jgi:hypothetical protein
MLVREGIGKYRHADGDTYDVDVTCQGTGFRAVATLGTTQLTMPKHHVTKANYQAYSPAYEINVLVTFLLGSTPNATYTIKFTDAGGTLVDTAVVRLPAGSALPFDINSTFAFKVI